MQKLITCIVIVLAALTGCSRDATSCEAADKLESMRRVVFYNRITGDHMLTIEGRCSISNRDGHGKVSVTCKTGPIDYKRHALGLSDNVSFVVEQMDASNVGDNHYRVTFKPSAIVPKI